MIRAALFFPLAVLVASVGCANIQVDVPDGYTNRRSSVDSSHVPKVKTLTEARIELQKAYNHMRYLENKVRHYKNKAQKRGEDKKDLERKYKAKIKPLEKKIKHLKKQLERYED